MSVVQPGHKALREPAAISLDPRAGRMPMELSTSVSRSLRHDAIPLRGVVLWSL